MRPAAEGEVVIGWREGATVLALLLVLLAAAYANVVFAGRSLVYTDNYNVLDFRFTPQSYGPDVQAPEIWQSRNLLFFANFHDPDATWLQWEPAAEFLHRGIRSGEWPWWDPYVGGGAPAMANLTPSFAFPPYLLVVALGNDVTVKNVYFLSLLLAAAFFSYLLLRKHHLSPEASFAGAAAVLFCGGLNQNAGSFIGQTAAGLPVALFLTRVFLDRPTWRRAALVASGYAVLALASFPPLLIASFGLSALYAVVQIAAERDRRAAVRYAVAVVLALGLVAFYYLPAFAVVSEVPQAQSLYREAADMALPWYSLSQLVSPVLFGGSKVWAEPPMRDPGKLSIPYVGAVALLLGGLAGPAGPRRTRRFFWILAAAGTVIALKLCGIEPIQSLGRLPGLRTVHFAVYYGIPLNLLLGFAAGLGMERLLAGRVSRLRTAGIVLGLGAVTAAMPWVAKIRFTLSDVHAEDWLDRWYLFVVLLVMASGGLLVLAWQGARTPRRRLAFTAWIVAVLAVEGVCNTYYPRQSRWDVWKHPIPCVRALMDRRDEGRVFSWGPSVLTANAGSAFEVFQVDSLMTFNAPRMFELYRHYASRYTYLFLREALELPPDPVLDAANVATVASREARPLLGIAAEERGYREIFDDGYVRLFHRETEPRYYFTSDVRRLTREEALPALAGRRPREVLVEEAPGFPAVPNDGHEPPAVVESFTRNRVVLRVEAPRPGLLYASESFFPGWKATVNGRPAPILAANYAFRAVPVPAGRAVVELSYFPPGLAAGLVVSAVAALATALLALWRPQRPL